MEIFLPDSRSTRCYGPTLERAASRSKRCTMTPVDVEESDVEQLFRSSIESHGRATEKWVLGAPAYRRLRGSRVSFTNA